MWTIPHIWGILSGRCCRRMPMPDIADFVDTIPSLYAGRTNTGQLPRWKPYSKKLLPNKSASSTTLFTHKFTVGSKSSSIILVVPLIICTLKLLIRYFGTCTIVAMRMLEAWSSFTVMYVGLVWPIGMLWGFVGGAGPRPRGISAIAVIPYSRIPFWSWKSPNARSVQPRPQSNKASIFISNWANAPKPSRNG